MEWHIKPRNMKSMNNTMQAFTTNDFTQKYSILVRT